MNLDGLLELENLRSRIWPRLLRTPLSFIKLKKIKIRKWNHNMSRSGRYTSKSNKKLKQVNSHQMAGKPLQQVN